MRAAFALAALLALSACGNNDQTDNTQNVDENLTAENIVSNDVTAIDAVTGDAANMAADSDMNFGNLDENAANEAAPSPSEKPLPRPAKPKVQPDEPTTNAITNAE
jgi:hypothetical protein